MISSRTLCLASLSALCLLLGCGPRIPASSSGSGTFKDDLSEFRPVYAAVETGKNATPAAETKPAADRNAPAGDITARLNTALDTIASTNKHLRYAQGYRVQVYSGSSSEEANRARERSYGLFPDITPHIAYVQPNFRVKVGDFIDRLEAQRVLVALRAAFPNAIVVPERIEIR